MGRLFTYTFIFALLVTAACTKQQEAPSEEMYVADDKAQAIVDKAIEISGGDLYKQTEVKFVFRGLKFTVIQDDTSYFYERITNEEGKAIKDVLKDGLLTREENGNSVELTERQHERVHEGVNSVPYFAMLPYKLNDAAVVKEYVGEVQIKGKTYDKIKITFEGEGSGTSPDNVFYYWFNKETGFMDYLGYSRGGNRFREAYNQRVVNGIRFADYINYKSDALLEPDVSSYDELFDKGELRELSRIILDDVQVRKVGITN